MKSRGILRTRQNAEALFWSFETIRLRAKMST